MIRKLAQVYPQLYLNPDCADQEDYKKVVLRGLSAETEDLSHFSGDPRDHKETAETPAGPVEVITLYDRRDFELFIRAMMAAKEGPLAPVPKTQGAATIATFNWPRINAHKEKFFLDEKEKGNLFPDWGGEFARFRQVKSNYIDWIIVLSVGPYSNVPAEAMGLSEEAWIEKSHLIRKYHECTHFVCRNLYPDRIDAVYDELVADAIGLYAAFGTFEPEKEKLFLGIKEGRYTGGRLENYVEKDRPPDALASECEDNLERFEKLFCQNQGKNPFEMISLLMR